MAIPLRRNNDESDSETESHTDLNDNGMLFEYDIDHTKEESVIQKNKFLLNEKIPS